MNIRELIQKLQAVVEADEYAADMSVTFGTDMEPVEGGIVGKRKGLVVLNLAPTSYAGNGCYSF